MLPASALRAAAAAGDRCLERFALKPLGPRLLAAFGPLRQLRPLLVEAGEQRRRPFRTGELAGIGLLLADGARRRRRRLAVAGQPVAGIELHAREARLHAVAHRLAQIVARERDILAIAVAPC